MKTKQTLLFAVAVAFISFSLSSLASNDDSPGLNAYKLGLAHHIAATNTHQMYSSRPQALLRSVVVLNYSIDADGNLAHSRVIRSNQDPVTEAIALASLRSSAPFPKPASELLRRGPIELSETWLFNTDGRFQLRTTALPQMDQ